MWSTEAWDILRIAFPSNNGSKILVTTRIVDVAISCSSTIDDRIYQMQPLSLHQSRRLFVKRCENIFEDVVNDLLEKCGGLPLAIICISGLLASKPALKEEWVKVRNSLGSQTDKNSHLDRLYAILRMSYNVLPMQLKTCLLYLSLYPEDHAIERDSLINKWISEGFIVEERGQHIWDTAHGYFMELINRNLVQPQEIGFDGQARSCMLHDFVFELLVTIASQENFLTRLGDQRIRTTPYPIRRLSIQRFGPERLSYFGLDLSHVRSLTAFGTVKYIPPLAHFGALRILDFECCENIEEYDFIAIEEQKQLSFLSLRDTSIHMLPAGVVQLLELRTLDLRGTEIVQLPELIINLVKLERLLVGDYGYGKTQIPEVIGKMKSLEVLSHFNVNHSTTDALENLGELNNLRDLGIHFDAQELGRSRRHEETLLSSLGRLNLRSVWISSRNSTPLNFLNSWSPLPLHLQFSRMTTNFFFHANACMDFTSTGTFIISKYQLN